MKTLLAISMLLMALGPQAQAQETDHSGHDMSAMETEEPADSAAEAYMLGMAKMSKDMTAPMSGDADRDFVVMMIPHHQGAIDMAKVQLKYGKDPEIRKLSEAVIKAQAAEIAMMKKWLAEHPAK